MSRALAVPPRRAADRTIAVACSIAVVTFALAACQGAPPPGDVAVGGGETASSTAASAATTPATRAADKPDAVAERPPTAVSQAGAAFEGGDNASFEGVTIVWPAGLARGAGVRSDPASAGSPDAAPPATTFILDGYADEEAQFPATVRVYALGQGGPDLADAVASLRTILADRPAEPKVPMPATPASRLFLAQVRYVDGEGYRGVRFVTQLAQDVQPVNNASLVYAFEGLSDDGARWIQARLPIDAMSDAVLPNANVDDYAGFAARFDDYIVQTAAAVDALAPAAFTPTLDELDALVANVRLP